MLRKSGLAGARFQIPIFMANSFCRNTVPLHRPNIVSEIAQPRHTGLPRGQNTAGRLDAACAVSVSCRGVVLYFLSGDGYHEIEGLCL